MLRFDDPVTALRAFGFVTRAFDLQSPLLERSIAMNFQLFQAE